MARASGAGGSGWRWATRRDLRLATPARRGGRRLAAAGWESAATTPGRAVDRRLRAAIDASIGWYEDLCAAHGIGSAIDAGLWVSRSAPPPLHSDAVLLQPTVTERDVLEAIAGRVHAGVKDSFATLDLTGGGMQELFSATWIHREATDDPPNSDSATLWRQVTTPEELAEWTDRHDTSDVLLPRLLDRAHVSILARYEGDRRVAGAVARLGTGVVDISNVHGVDADVDWSEVAQAVAQQFPGRAMVGYERGDDLVAARAAGFDAVGELRVWTR